MGLNRSRIWLGGFVGGIVWIVWSWVLNMMFLGPRYVDIQNSGLFLKQPRYPFFMGQWIMLLFLLAIIMSHLYAWSRATIRPGPLTAIKIGFLVGLAMGPHIVPKMCVHDSDPTLKLLSCRRPLGAEESP